MAYFRTCVGCATARATCSTLVELKKHLAGTGVTSIKHKCAVRTTEFQPGDAVWIELYADGYEEPDGATPNALFPGVVLEQVGTKVRAFIRPGAEGMNGFTFTGRANGYVSAPLGRVRRRNDERVEVRRCEFCGGYPALSGRCDAEIVAGIPLDSACLMQKEG